VPRLSKQNQHEIVQAIIDQAIELGRTPKQAEFTFATKWKVDQAFGSYSALIHAAGLDPSSTQTKKSLPNSVFEKNIEEHILELNLPKPVMPAMPHGTIAVISDIHWPFMNQKVVDRFLEYVGDEKPDYVIINGDAWDMYSHAKFPRSHNIFLPKEEEAMARKLNEDFWQEIKLRSKDSICFQMLGNHDVRPLKRTVEAMPTMEHWIQDYFKKLFSYEGVTTYFDPREEMIIGEIAIHHGHRSKLGDHRDDLLMNAIVGHTHKAGVVYRSQRNKVIWEMNSGLAGNPEAKGLTYTPQRMVQWTPSFGAVNKYGPQVVIV
jgi:predicted phosphodiesterase